MTMINFLASILLIAAAASQLMFGVESFHISTTGGSRSLPLINSKLLSFVVRQPAIRPRFPCSISLSAKAKVDDGSTKKRKKKVSTENVEKEEVQVEVIESKKTKAEVSSPKKTKEDEVSVPVVRKGDIVSILAAKTGMSKGDSEAALSAVLDVISQEVASGKKVNLSGFGTFKLTYRAARKGRNPRTGEEIDIAASSSPSFLASKGFKDKVNA